MPEVTCEDLAAAGAQKHKTKHPAGAPFRHCGFVIPCDADEYCDETQARTVQGGINVINGRGRIEWLPVRAAV